MLKLFLFAIFLAIFGCPDKNQNSKAPFNDPNLAPVNRNILKKLKSSNRISSNHYSDVVVDKNGNSYIASFYCIGQADYVFIVKVNAAGITEWELGTESEGRALAISINSKGEILVTGYFSNRLKLGATEVTGKGAKMFIAKINADGICKWVITNEGEGMAFDICLNEDGTFLIGGNMGAKLSFDTTEWVRADLEKPGFLALFDKDGDCKWIKDFNASITRIRSHRNNFIITGAFADTLEFEGEIYFTTSGWDRDGFLLYLYADENKSWLKQFGAEGIIKNGYRTDETGWDIAFDSDSAILVAAYINKNAKHDLPDIYVLTYSHTGDLLKEKKVVSEVTPAAVTLFKSGDDSFWLTGMARNQIKLDNQSIQVGEGSNSFILNLDDDLKLVETILPLHKPEKMVFRSSFSGGRKIVFTGHFDKWMVIDGDTLQSTEKHELFMYSLSLEKDNSRKR